MLFFFSQTQMSLSFKTFLERGQSLKEVRQTTENFCLPGMWPADERPKLGSGSVSAGLAAAPQLTGRTEWVGTMWTGFAGDFGLLSFLSSLLPLLDPPPASEFSVLHLCFRAVLEWGGTAQVVLMGSWKSSFSLRGTKPLATHSVSRAWSTCG